MKVCHVISGYFRNDARNFQRQAKSLKQVGYDVCFVTNDQEPDEEIEGINFISCSRHYPRWRVLVAAKTQFLPELLRVNADVYQLHSPELLPLVNPLRRHGKLIVYDAHEDLPRHLIEKEWVPKFFRWPLSWLAESYMSTVLRQIDEVISPHSHVVAHLQKKIQRGVLVANFPRLSQMPEVTLAEYAARSSRVCYTGTVYAYSNQESTLDAIAAIPQVRYTVAGYVDDRHRAALATRTGYRQSEYLGRLGQMELRKLYQSSIAGLVIYDYKQNLGWKLGSYGTNKIFEYMEAGLPIICTNYTLWRDIVERHDCGICVEPGSVDGIRDAINQLDKDRNQAWRMGQNGRNAVRTEFNWTSEERKYLDVYTRLAQRLGTLSE